MKTIFNKKRIGVFGGSFDPPHKGHQYVVERCLVELNLNKIYLIPSYHTPNKNPSTAPPEARWQMVRQVFASIPQVQVLDIEIKRKGMSYTKDTLNELNLNDEVFLILGEDVFLQFCSWKDYQKIMDQVHLAVFLREDPVLKKGKRPVELSSFVQHYTKNVWYLKNGQQIIFLKPNSSYKRFSSTQVKNKIQSGLPIENDVDPVLHRQIGNYYKHLVSISSQNLSKDVFPFLKEKGALDSQLFSFKQDIYEYILVTSGLNTRHVRSLFFSLKEHIKKIYGIEPYHVEGENLFQWVVMDYGFLIVHIFYDYLRDYYQLEDLWKKRSIS